MPRKSRARPPRPGPGTSFALVRRKRASAAAHVKTPGLLTIACLVLLATGCGEGPPCGAAAGAARRSAARGLRRGTESVAALKVLGLHWSADPHQSDVLLLGYPDLGLTQIAAAESSWTDDPAGLHHTYGEDLDGSGGRCNGDLHQLLEGTDAELTERMRAAD